MSDRSFARCACLRCGNTIEFPVDAAGSRIDCPHCSEPTELTLPFEASLPPESEFATAHFTSASSPTLTVDDMRAGFRGGIQPSTVSGLYSLGMLLSALVMLLLPLLYVGGILAVGWGVYEYATHAWKMVTGLRGGLYFLLLRWLLYIAPIFAGLVLVVFMIKPLFAKRAPSAQPLALNPDVEPLLFAFIREICLRVGAPMPTRIDLDCQLNASASFRRGAGSMASQDLVLTIGLPLVAGLNMRQLAGVLAHEFGHFRQGFAMRVSYLVRSINFWFARVVYERDALDVALTEWAEEANDGWSAFLVGFTQLAVWISRQILKLFMLMGNAASCFLMRQMEYNADDYEIRLAGSAAFESTMIRNRILAEAVKVAYKQARTSWNLNHRLPDDFPDFVLQREAALPAQTKERIANAVGLATTGLFDSHPSDGDRIRRARLAGEPGVFDLEWPSTLLFSDFHSAAQLVTRVHYEDDLGLPMLMAKLVPVEKSPEAGSN